MHSVTWLEHHQPWWRSLDAVRQRVIINMAFHMGGSTRVRKSGTWLKTALVTAAWAALRTKNSYLFAQFTRIKARRGSKKANCSELD